MTAATGRTAVDAPEQAVICGYWMDGQGGGQPLPEIPPATRPTTGFYWLHLQSDSAEAAAIMRKMGLGKTEIDALTATETRPRATKLGDHVLLILRGVNNSPDADPDDMVSLRLLMTDVGIISARKHQCSVSYCLAHSAQRKVARC